MNVKVIFVAFLNISKVYIISNLLTRMIAMLVQDNIISFDKYLTFLDDRVLEI